MNAHDRNLQRMLSAIAAEAGGRLVAIQTTGGGHRKVTLLDRNGVVINLIAAGTPSDHRDRHNTRAQARRVLRDALGVEAAGR